MVSGNLRGHRFAENRMGSQVRPENGVTVAALGTGNGCVGPEKIHHPVVLEVFDQEWL